MKQKSDSDEPVYRAEIILGEDDTDTEFDDAVTSEIKSINVVMVTDDNSAQEIEPVAAAYEEQPAEDLPTDDDKALDPGTFLGDRFEIESLVHSGGMGHVYKAIDHRRHARAAEQVHVAIKMLRRSIASRLDADAILEREAAKTRHLAHPNIVNVFDHDQHEDQFYIVMEWLEGESLNALLRRTRGQRLEPRFAWRIVEGIAAGLQHAHAHNVVHADVNPSNIFITETQQIKLLDFGIARDADDPGSSTAEPTVWATRTYASPEVLSGLAPGFQDDIFSLGCVAYRLMSGAHPFSGLSSVDARDVGAEVRQIAGLPEPRWQTLRRALSFDRSERPGSAGDFIASVTTAPEPDLTGEEFGGSLPRWWPVLPVAAAVVVAGFWWFSPGRIESAGPAAVDAPVVGGGPTVSPEVEALSVETTEILSRAAVAAEEARLVTPVGESARDLYREVLARDPSNESALGGLRAISDAYLQQATAAVTSGDIAAATEALNIAVATSPENPGIAIVNALVLAQGDSQLARAQLAAADGDPERALDLLSEAERYGTIDTAAIDALRGQFAQTIEERRFLDALATADGHLSAGRLIAPAGNNAHGLLLELEAQRGDEPRLNASMERLGERLLARAAFAAAAGNFGEASRMLRATETLGVLEKDVVAAQRSLQRARARAASARAATEQAARAQPAAAAPKVAATPDGEQAASTIETNDPPAGTPAETASADAAARAGSVGIDAVSQPRKITLTDLAIEKYVAPKYPRSARRRGSEGFVRLRFSVNPDGSTGAIETLSAEPGRIFVASAEKAISQWRFAPREDVVTTRITLNFSLEP